MFNINSRISNFEEKVFAVENKGYEFHDGEMEKAMNGLNAGLHIIAGCSNHGKSILLNHLELGLLTKNPELCILNFTLDDTLEDKYSRLVAAYNGVPINFIQTPLKNNIVRNESDENYKKWKDITSKVYKLMDRYRLIDSEETRTIEGIDTIIKNTLEEMAKYNTNNGNPDKKPQLIVTIDSFHDLTCDDTKIGHDMKWEYIAKEVQSLSKRYDIPVIVTAELKKLNGSKRPLIDDIRDSIKIQFAAKTIMLIYNEVSQKGEAAKTHYTSTGIQGKQPVLEVHFIKNKNSSFKGRIYYLFRPEMAKLKLASTEQVVKFDQNVYGN